MRATWKSFSDDVHGKTVIAPFARPARDPWDGGRRSGSSRSRTDGCSTSTVVCGRRATIRWRILPQRWPILRQLPFPYLDNEESSGDSGEFVGNLVSHSSGVGRPAMFVFARAATYSALFIGLLLMFLPRRILSSTGVIQPAAIGAWQVAGMLLGASGAALALTCILTFVFVGRGTPAPFDPPRRLVVRGPYRFIGIRCTSVPVLR